MNQISKEAKITENNASFIAYFCRGMKPWIDSKELSEEQRNTTIPAILFLNRWDGRVGFPGGNVDGNETFKEAAIRESIEEIAFRVEKSELHPICSHNFPAGNTTLSTHLYSKEISQNELLDIQLNIVNSGHYGSEVMGSTICLVGDFGRGKGFPAFINSPMASSVKEEIFELLLDRDLLTKEELEKMILTSNNIKV